MVKPSPTPKQGEALRAQALRRVSTVLWFERRKIARKRLAAMKAEEQPPALRGVDRGPARLQVVRDEPLPEPVTPKLSSVDYTKDGRLVHGNRAQRRAKGGRGYL